MLFGQTEYAMEFTIPYASAAQQAEVEAMGGSTVANLASGSYTLVSTQQFSSAKSSKNRSKMMGLEVDCSNITDSPLSCRADLPSVDFSLPLLMFDGVVFDNTDDIDDPANVTLTALTVIPGDLGCPGDAIIIERTYFVQDDMGTMLQCMQTFTVESQNGPTLACPSDVTLTCFDEDTSPANTGMAVATSECSTVMVLFSDVSTQVMDGSVNQYNYTITRTWVTSMDGCGRSATSCDQLITVTSDSACLTANGIPTMGQWALFILALLISSLAIVFIRMKSFITV